MPKSQSAFVAILLVTFLVVLGSLNVRAVPVPALNLDFLSNDSTLIVSGEVLFIRNTGQTTASYGDLHVPAQSFVGSIRVDQVLKGTTTANTASFRFYVPTEDVGWQPVSEGYGVFFFKSGQSGDLVFTSPYYPYLPTTPAARIADGSVIEKVVFALKSRLVSPASTVNQKSVTVFYLSRTKCDAATAALHEALQDPTREVQLSAAGALLERNDTVGLELAKAALLNPASISPVMSHNLTYAISSGLKDTKAIAALGELKGSPDPEIRRAVASSLMHMESPDAIDILKSLLDDSDFETRYYAVAGLAQITHQTAWHPGMEGFRADERKYLEHWRNWIPAQ